jgi:hypothetical protein
MSSLIPGHTEKSSRKIPAFTKKDFMKKVGPLQAEDRVGVDGEGRSP